jgi:hypothetical protein
MTQYYCVEDNRLISILNYEPAVPDTVTVTEVSDQDHARIADGECWFNVDLLCVEQRPDHIKRIEEERRQQSEHRAFLQRTDWQVLRHIREQALGQPTTLTQEEYLELERQRDYHAGLIKD